jgi:pyruvate, orthophosphate dikinase
MTWVHPLSAEVAETADVLGAKAHGLIMLRRLGLPVPQGFVIGTPACREFLRDGRFPPGLDAELASAVHAFTGAVSVRSGGSVSMPGMMNTILDVPLPDLEPAVEAVFSSWHTPRARTYRELHGIPHDLGTAVTVQAMVYGDRDDHSGAGVAFSRDPNTGEPAPFGEVLFGHQGEAVVSGRSVTQPLRTLADREPLVWQDLRSALRRIEEHCRDACSVEFTFESGRLWLLQVRAGGLVGRAAVRVAVDLVDEGVLSPAEAVLRVPPGHRRLAPRLSAAGTDVFTRGLGACPGVATGRVATTADAAVRMAGPVILVRPHTSPLDMHGLAAAAGIVTATGGPASHAAVVARSMGKPAVVAATGLTVEASCVRAGGRTLPEGTVITIDGAGGEVVVGSADVVTDATDPYLSRLLAWADVALGWRMADFAQEDLAGSRFERVVLTGARFRSVDLTGGRLHDVDLTDVMMRGVIMSGADIDGYIGDLKVNGVEVGPFVEAELDRRYPDRVKMRPTDPAGFREAWDVVERLWDGTVERARGLAPDQLHESVDGEWSFIETLRHLVSATDAWVRRALLGDPAPWHPLGLMCDDLADTPGVPQDRDARPSLDEVLALRRDRMATVREFVDGLTDESLAAHTKPVEAPGWPPPVSHPVRKCLRIILNEEWEHRLFAERDLDALTR